MLHSISRGAVWLPAAIALSFCIVTFYFSLNHPVSADLAMLHYSAWLINEQHFVLYRDIFDINFPAPYLFHSALGKLVGYEALPLRWVDFFLMASLGWASWTILSPVSKPAAITGFSFFCLLYWVNAGEFVLERDVLALVPAVVAFALAGDTLRSRTTTIAIGVLTATACSMKPNTIVIVPVLLWMLCGQTEKNQRRTFLYLFFCTATLTALTPFIWIGMQGGLDSFLDIYRHYMPIYANSRYDLWHYENSTERWTTLLKQYIQFGGLSLLLSAPGLSWAWYMHRNNPVLRLRLLQLAAMTFAFTFYEVLAGKFWTNHMFPSAFWSFLCFSLLLCAPKNTAPRWQHFLALVLLVPCIALIRLLGVTALLVMQQAHEREINEPMAWRARQIAHYLSTHTLQKKDTVQVFDMAGDGQAALLQAKATSATRFLIDVPLWMRPESSATQALRQQFLTELQQQKPAYIIYVEQFLHPGGGNRLKEFKPLYEWINGHYEVAEQQEGSYLIYHKKLATP